MPLKQLPRLLLALALTVLTFSVNVPAAHASGVVTNCANDTDFSSKLSGGGLITFNCGGVGATATITLTSMKTISAATTIDGGGKISLSGGNALRLFLVNSGQSLDLKNIVVEDGNPGSSNGGAIENDGFLAMENSTIKGSSAGAYAGGLLTTGAADITDCKFLNNKAFNGGAIVASGSNAQVTLAGSVLKGNEATGSGSDGRGGAILELSGATVNIFSSTLSGNSATNQGGAINVSDANSSLNLQGSTVHKNKATKQGGGIYNDGSATLGSDTIDGNSLAQGGDGGGIFNDSGSHLNLTNVTLSGNSSVSAYGGGIFNDLGTADLTNVTLSGNSAGTDGGGIFNYLGSHLNLTNVILTNSPAGGNCYLGSAPDIANSDLSTDGTCGFGDGRNNVAILLGPLETNGGFTLTKRLLPGSLAIDDGTSSGAPSDDQRGVSRPQGSAVDVGAVEFVPCSGSPTKPTLVSPAVNARVKVTKVLVDWAGPDCATSFKVTVRQDSTSGPIVFSATRFPASQATTSQLLRGHLFYWHVTACDTSGCTTGPWWTFKISG